MIYLIFIGVSALLLGGFFLLIAVERNSGNRVLGSFRAKLDRKVSRTAFIATHVDWGAFARHLAGTALERVLHDIAHTILQMVRATERILTRAVKTLRERRGMPVAEEDSQDAASPLARSLDRVRTALRSARKAPRNKA
ncbi:MAG TPA: hypothetical protein VGE53_03630 [Candidatus Paceibacterota bacterium]